MKRFALALLLVATGCGWPLRTALISEIHGRIDPIDGFEDVRGVDGYPSEALQKSFDAAIAKLAESEPEENGRRAYDMLVLSSGGVNGAFGAGILTEWSVRGDRPDFWFVTGVSVGGLMAPFAFAGPEFDDRLETLFRRIQPHDLHREKGVLSSVLWDESLMDSAPLQRLIDRAIDMELIHAMAERHEEGRRCFVGSTNLDVGDFVVWDLGAIATRRTEEAAQLIKRVLAASAAIPVVYPPVRFSHGDRDELHVDGAVMRPLFIPQNVFDGYASADKVKLSWDDIDATLYVIHNGSLRPRPIEVQRETLSIAMRTVMMMSYTMVSEHILHLYMLTRAWGAEFRMLTMPDGVELSVDSFGPEDTERLFFLGQGLVRRRENWETAPPGYVVRGELSRMNPAGPAKPSERVPESERSTEARLESIESELRALREDLKRLNPNR